MKMKHKFKYIIVLFSLCQLAFSQENSLGSWNILNFKYNLTTKYSFFLEGQLRSLQLYQDFHYFEYKAGLNYRAFANTNGTLGLGNYQTYKEGGNFVLPKNNNEFRIWPQLTLTQTVWKLKIEQRYRLELRFTSQGFRNRYRYRFGVSYPFGNSNKNFKPYQISISNEIFFTNKEPYFERNRFLVAYNYKPIQSTTLQIGYLNQFDYKINDETGRDFLQLGIFYELSSKKCKTISNEIEQKDN